MPTRRPREPFNALVLAALAVVVSAVLIAAGGGGRHVAPTGKPSWQGLAGAQRPRVAVGQRVIVLLKAPALADRVGNAGGLATSEDERRWTHSALSTQKLLVARLRLEGVVVQPAFTPCVPPIRRPSGRARPSANGPRSRFRTGTAAASRLHCSTPASIVRTR